MNRHRLLTLSALALALGIFASLWVYRKLQVNNGASAEAMAEVMVAADDLQVGGRVEERDIKIVKIPLAALPQGSPRRKSEIVGRGVVVPIRKGQFILTTDLAGENAGSGLPSLIPPGMRAVSLRVNDVTGVSGFATPGTRVDVLLTGTFSGAEQQTVVVLQNVAIIGTGLAKGGHTVERTSTGEPQNATVATLLTTVEDAEKLILASSQGHIQLILRNPIDTRSEDVNGATLKQLYMAPLALVPRPRIHRTTLQKSTPPPELQIDVIEGQSHNKVSCGEDGQCSDKQ